MISAEGRWGPFADGLDPGERTARLRALRAIARLSCGPRGDAVCDALRQAETDLDALEPAAIAIGRLDPLDYRRVLSSFAAVHRSQPITRRGSPCR